ncbi:a-factor receptor [Serendipita sp. 396]|nr:a-factor receptor [Serendipita sp. 396]KAG8767921.1 a-factor receptor [Serendipita sp. 397]
MTFKNFSYMYPVYPILCIFSAIFALIPLATHWMAGNIGAVSLALWIIGGNVMAAVNTIVWRGNLRNPHPVWGDICQAYFSVMNFAISAATLYIQFHLWKVARNKRLLVSVAERRRQKIWGICWCYGIPVLFVVLHYIVQGHRYDVAEDLGPMPTTYLTPVAFAVYYIWDPIMCLISIGFSLHTYWIIIRHRKQMAKVFVSSKKNSEKRYYRLLAMSLMLTLLHLPLVLWVVIYNATVATVYPWISWEDTHSNYMRISYISRTMAESFTNFVTISSISYWAVTLCGFTFFLFFGTGTEARRQYWAALTWVAARFGIKLPERKKKEKKNPTASGVSASVAGTPTWFDRLFGRRGGDDSFLSTLGTSTTTAVEFSTSFNKKESSSRGVRSPMNKARVDETISISPSVDHKRDGDDFKRHNPWMETSMGEVTSGEYDDGIALEVRGESAIEQGQQQSEHPETFLEMTF